MTLKTTLLLLAVILVTYLTVCQTKQDGCPDDWDVVKRKCFRFFVPSTGSTTFEKAEEICSGIDVTCQGRSVNGALARIPCAAMQNKLVRLAKEKGLKGNFFIGLTVDENGEESWVSGGQSVRYSAWAKKEDNRANSLAVMSFSDYQNFGKWKPVDITTKANYLCMLPCVVDTING